MLDSLIPMMAVLVSLLSPWILGTVLYWTICGVYALYNHRHQHVATRTQTQEA